MPTPKEIPKNWPAPMVAPHPLRVAIHGKTHTLDEVAKIIDGSEIHAGLKSWLADELKKMETNGASIHLHLVDHPGGGCSLHITLAPFSLG